MYTMNRAYLLLTKIVQWFKQIIIFFVKITQKYMYLRRFNTDFQFFPDCQGVFFRCVVGKRSGLMLNSNL